MYKGLELFSTVLSKKIGRKLSLWVLQDTLHTYQIVKGILWLFFYFGSKKRFFKESFLSIKIQKGWNMITKTNLIWISLLYLAWSGIWTFRYRQDSFYRGLGLMECWGSLAKQLADRKKVFTCNNTRHSCCEWSHVYFTGIRGISVKGHK